MAHTKVDTAHFPDQGGDGATKNQILATKAETPRLSRPRRKWRNSSEQGGEGATFQTNAETARPRKISPRPFWIRRDPSYQGGDGLTFQTKTELAHFFKRKGRCRNFPDRDKYGATKKVSLRPRWVHSIPGWRQHHFPERDGDGATKKTFPATAVDTARPFIPGWRRPDFPDQDRIGAFFQTKREMPRFSRPRQIRRDQEIILAPAVDTFHTRVQAASFSRTRRRRRDQENVPCDRVGYGATLAIRVDMAHTKVDTAQLSRPRRRRRNQESNSRDQGGDAASFQTKAEMARLFRTGWRGRYFPDQRGDGATKKNFPATAVDTGRPFIPGWRRPDFPDQDRVGAFFQTKREMPRFSRPRQIRRVQESILAPAVDTFHTRVETASLSRTRRRRRDQENIPRGRRGYDATFIPGWRRPDFPDQDSVGAFFQTKREMPRFSRPRQIRRD